MRSGGVGWYFGGELPVVFERNGGERYGGRGEAIAMNGEVSGRVVAASSWIQCDTAAHGYNATPVCGTPHPKQNQ